MFLYFLTGAGILLAMQYQNLKEYDETEKPSIAKRERLLDMENARLDREIAALLGEHRALCEKRSLLIDGDLLMRFDELEEGDGEGE